MEVDTPTDEALMRAYVQGDHEAFRELFARYAPVLTRLTLRHLRSEELARDVVQQTFFQMHAARHDFRSDRKLRPWVFTIAMNLVREHYRRKKRRRETQLDETRAETESIEPRAPIEMRQRAELLHAALDKLPASQREVVELHWFEERPYAEVAQNRWRERGSGPRARASRLPEAQGAARRKAMTRFDETPAPSRA